MQTDIEASVKLANDDYCIVANVRLSEYISPQWEIEILPPQDGYSRTINLDTPEELATLAFDVRLVHEKCQEIMSTWSEM